MALPQSIKVLLVEDDRINALVFKEFFSDIFDIDYAGSGREAIDFIETGNYKLAFLDIHLGDENFTGIDLLNLIRQKEKSLQPKVYALTGYAMSGDEKKFMDLGFDNYVSKPIDFALLRNDILKRAAAV